MHHNPTTCAAHTFNDMPQHPYLPRHSGFTLLEVLVVVVIISIMITMTTLSIGDRSDAKAKEEMDRIMTLIRLAKEEAVFQSRDFAISFWQKGYAFHELTPAGWQTLTDDPVFKDRKLPEDMKFELYLEGIEAILNPIPKNEPQVFILSSMETSTFKLHLIFENRLTLEFEIDALGKMMTPKDKAREKND